METLKALLDTVEYFEYNNCILLLLGLYVAAMVTFKK